MLLSHPTTAPRAPTASGTWVTRANNLHPSDLPRLNLTQETSDHVIMYHVALSKQMFQMVSLWLCVFMAYPNIISSTVSGVRPASPPATAEAPAWEEVRHSFPSLRRDPRRCPQSRERGGERGWTSRMERKSGEAWWMPAPHQQRVKQAPYQFCRCENQIVIMLQIMLYFSLTAAKNIWMTVITGRAERTCVPLWPGKKWIMTDASLSW